MLLRGAGVAVENGERHEHAALVVDAGEPGMGQKVEALLAAVVGVLAPADVGERQAA